MHIKMIGVHFQTDANSRWYFFFFHLSIWTSGRGNWRLLPNFHNVFWIEKIWSLTNMRLGSKIFWYTFNIYSWVVFVKYQGNSSERDRSVILHIPASLRVSMQWMIAFRWDSASPNWNVLCVIDYNMCCHHKLFQTTLVSIDLLILGKCQIWYCVLHENILESLLLKNCNL